MKRQLTNILCIPVVLAGIIFPFFLSGCSREEMIKEEIQEGIPTSVDLKFAVEGGDVYTKAEQSILIENRVRNLYVLQFSSDGKLVGRQLYTVGASGDVVSYFEKQEEDDGASSGIIQNFPAVSGSDCSFMAFANLNQTLRNELQNVQNIAEVNEIVYEDPSDGNIERNFFIMTALLDKIDVDDNPDTPLGIIFILKRLDAKITFNVNLDIEEALASEPVTLTNLRFRVHNIPSNSYLVGREKVSDIVVGMDNTWDSQEQSFTTMSNYANFDSTYANTDGGLFHFYLKENRPVPKKMITNQDREGYSSLYAMREAWFVEGGQSAGTPVLGREFIYAPDNATFVEITGHLEYTRYNKDNSSNEYVDADVVYLVHLGETGQSTDMNDETKVNNYDVRRNVHYVYKVTIQGVNSMIVEVEDEIDSRPGNEGDLSISTNRKVAFDSHYGRAFFQISSQNLEEASWSAESAIWGRTAIEDDGMISSPYDYKWMLFAINSEFGASNESDSKVMVKFPGLIAYDKGTDFFDSNGSLRPKEQLINEIKTDKGNAFIVNGRKYTFKQLLEQGVGDYSENYYKNQDINDSACLRDINQLINYLKENNQLFNDDGLVNITAFCEEYTYVYEPRKDNYVYQGTPVNIITSDPDDQRRRLALWKTYTNSGSRILNIQPMTSTLVSPDGNTTYTNSYISFSQNPIYTVYNTNEASTAWGLETINETGLLNYKNSNTINGNLPNTTGNGRQNFLNFFISGNNEENIKYKWTEIMTTDTDVDDENGLRDRYRNLIYACLSRNRDLNGNDQIDNDELLWYLASIDQLTTIFVAQDALSRDQWLYTGNGTERHHVVSSSYKDVTYFDAEKLWLIWAEEGASRGDVRGSLNQLHNENYIGDHMYDYRCVRNLGIDISHIDEQPQHYAEYRKDGNRYTIDLSRLNAMAYRTAFDDGDMLPLTDERSETDKPFKSFQVKEDLEYSGNTRSRRSMSWLQMRDSLNNNQNPCPDGWRVPNLREMLIIISTINGEHEAQDNTKYDLEWPEYTNIATSFSFNGVSPNYSKGDRYGFRYDYPNIRLLDEDAANGGKGNWSWSWFWGWSYEGWSGGEYPVNFRCVRDVE